MISRVSAVMYFSILLCASQVAWSQNALVFQTDFGLEEPAVASMKGVAYGVSPDLKMFDITHEIPVFNIWEAAYRLNQTARYWPPGTVFVSVVDPGVGTERKSVVLKTKSGHYFVSPDNGSLTLVAETLGIDEVRRIDETVNRLEGSERSYTFHGRDVYAYTGARLASGVISYKQVGVGVGDSVWVKISDGTDTLFEKKVRFVSSFGGVELGDPALYVNDILNIGLAINQGNFAEQYGVEPGPDRNIEIWK